MTKKRVLCMYSGGIDSTGMLYEILEKKMYEEYDLHVHHVSMVSRRNRHELEQQSVINTLRWFKEKYERKIIFTKNIIDFNFFSEYIPDDTDVLYFVMAQIPLYCINVEYEKILIGETKTDIQSFMRQRSSKIENLSELELFHYRANKLYEICFSPRIFEEKNPRKVKMPKIERPVVHMHKKEIMQKMPKELLAMTWSCRIPIIENNKYQECMRCNSCRDKYNLVWNHKLGRYWSNA